LLVADASNPIKDETLRKVIGIDKGLGPKTQESRRESPVVGREARMGRPNDTIEARSALVRLS